MKSGTPPGNIKHMNSVSDIKHKIWIFRRRILIFLAVFGPATIAAMADNDAAGVATYLQAGAKLGYPILFILIIVTILLAITQEMGIRLAIISRKGLGDHIREKYGLKISIFVFSALLLANLGTITADVSAIKIISELFNLPSLITIVFLLVLASLFVVRGNYRINQTLMLLSSLFFLTFIFSAVKAKPDWGLALSNLFFPHGVTFDRTYLISFLVMGMSILGTTITPWGQFFISSFSFDKNIDPQKLKYSQLETYIGAFLTDFFSFFMIVSTAATLFVYGLTITTGEEAALAIKPFAGQFASLIFAFGILNAGFMGMIIIALTTAYAFSEFFGFSGSLDAAYHRGKMFYRLFLFQIITASLIVLLPSVNLFRLALFTQTINAMMLPAVFYFLLKFTADPKIMGKEVNSPFKHYFALISIAVILLASFATLLVGIFNL
ncbi:hypothetical protein A2781_00850 [Candidatus Gottesmanbacteria bacterium RIFCSPHIGHO2_01_FULL_42_27]|uniref:Mn transporter n=2 Tax=Candidatus Gottesmaniibacteriota TaxID=1752720 RepID=A0A1F6BJW6_9BACT|nr:MAG: hypothetical protein A2781_00850 [Candidatus Gottesmanbacteria bacterium RIFCSPHIGHO2_01_FULL_42_27]OGG22523.1 MAG: hypothetical protein A3E72_03690 [Candidatus Gottesmanbacteria bacterium RIFCSPHIGHO2_12_FULL_43_26]OGG34893.1 MAG: hypothetical protein A3G68_04440 [Candidatus Gottesmanbacteria bacterium RIFCSPLOWO2_12_FULL_42_10]OGG37190.1 MAG: hypothetical protein A2968_05145 [Candidatus Gottesmanbacteria bacterium RIFCSPLOWO2_01_FULL_42_22]